MEVNNGLKSDNIEKKIDNKAIQAEGEIYCETKSTHCQTILSLT